MTAVAYRHRHKFCALEYVPAGSALQESFCAQFPRPCELEIIRMDDAAGSGESSDTSPLAVAPSPPSSNFEQQAVKPHSPAPVLSESSSSTTIFSSSYADVVAAAVTAPPDKAHPPSAEGTQEAPTKREMTRVEKRLHRFIELVSILFCCAARLPLLRSPISKIWT